MNNYWSKLAKKIIPYVPGEQPTDRTYIKLNTNENPYPPSPGVLEIIKKSANSDLRLYPDPDCTELRDSAASYHKIKRDQVFTGNGSDEILAFSFAAFFDPGNIILFPDITYSFYPVYSDLFNINYETIPLNDDFEINIEKFMRINGGIVLANPNAPTGKYLSVEKIKQIVNFNYNNSKKTVIIDEAYIDFGGESSINLINEFPNILVIHTLSKSKALAGLRAAYAVGDAGLINGLEGIKSSFNSYSLDRLAIAGAAQALKDNDYYIMIREKVINTRKIFSSDLIKYGYKVIDSSTNFVFTSHPKVPAKEIFASLREKGILVRYFEKPRIDNFLRISIGTDEQMKIVAQALKSITEVKE